MVRMNRGRKCMKYSLLLWIISIVVLPSVQAQPTFSAFPSIAEPTETTEIRGNPVTMIQRAIDAWSEVYDGQLKIHQVEQLGSGPIKELWANISLTKPTDSKLNQPLSFLLNFYSRQIDSLTQDNPPEKLYFASKNSNNRLPKIYTYTPEMNSVVIEWLTEDAPLPDFLKLAGILSIDVDKIKAQAYLDDELFEEYINGISAVRIRLQPRSEMKEVEPDRYLWLDRNSYFPLRFAIEDDIHFVIDFSDYKINQNIDPKSILPKVPANTTINDLTQF